MSQESKIMFSIIGVSPERLCEVGDFLGLAATRMTSAVLGNREEVAWTYDIASGPYSSKDFLQDKLNQFLESNSNRIRELGRKYRTEIAISVTDDEVPSVGHLSVPPKTLANL